MSRVTAREETMDTDNSLISRDCFPQLGHQQVYADWTGAALYPTQLVDAFADRLKHTLLGNPHSDHFASVTSMEAVTEARRSVLNHFNAAPDVYDVIFTANASSAILLLQHYAWENGEFLLTADNHNSVNGLREIAKRAGARVRYCSLTESLELDEAELSNCLAMESPGSRRLFAFPAKSNYTGVVHSLDWIEKAQDQGFDVLLDAAAHAANDNLDLRKHLPQFVAVSFYKMFGFPTGVGCLIVRKDAYDSLHKSWFAGGTIQFIAVQDDYFVPEQGHGCFEDGTPNFQSIGAITAGIDFLQTLGDRKAHALGIAQKLYDNLSALRHGQNHVQLHNPAGCDIVTFSVMQGDKVVDAWRYEQAASKAGICVRTGCFCNPGVNETIFGYSSDGFKNFFREHPNCSCASPSQLREHSGGKGIGAIRCSFGFANTPEDATRITEFTDSFLSSI